MLNKEKNAEAELALLTVESAHELVQTLLDSNGRDLESAAAAMKPYVLAYSALYGLKYEIKKDPAIAFEAMKLMLAFTQTVHEDIVKDVDRAWLCEREASAMLEGCKGKDGGGEVKLSFYAEVAVMIREYLAKGKCYFKFRNEWVNWGKPGQRFISLHEALSRKGRDSVVLTCSGIHSITRELYDDAVKYKVGA